MGEKLSKQYPISWLPQKKKSTINCLSSQETGVLLSKVVITPPITAPQHAPKFTLNVYIHYSEMPPHKT